MATHLPQNQFLPNSVTPPSPAVTDTAGVSQPPDAPAGTISNSALASAMTADTDAAPDLTDPPVAASVLITESAPNEGRSREAPALDAPNTHEDAGATDCISEIFHYARKLMRGHQGFVLDEAHFMAEIDEEPLFLREDGYLRRNA